MPSLSFFQKDFNSFLEGQIRLDEPRNLYEPIHYIMSLGGKRLRPVLTLMATDLLGGDYKRAYQAALAIEVFHNFSLVHDDIMDDAPKRRGQDTVHVKWDINTGILSGDAMLIQAYQLLNDYDGSEYKILMNLFNDTAIKVCEGQQYDMDFETREDVDLDNYLQMITNKTAVLIAAALKMGGIIAKAPSDAQTALYNYGINLGVAFQIQDDYLDAFGDAAVFGKQDGGDIIEKKKTFLYLKAMELSSSDLKNELLDLYALDTTELSGKIQRVKDIFAETGAVTETQAAIEAYTEKAFDQLEQLSAYDGAAAALREFGTQLMNRNM